MTTSYYPITLKPADWFQSEPIIQISPALAQNLLLANDFLIVTIGKRSVHATVLIVESEANTILMSTNLFENFSLPIKTIPLLCAFIPAIQTLLLGPIIAVMTEVHEQDEPHFRSIHHFCEELHTCLNERGGFLYVFRSTDFSTQDTIGFYYDGQQWTKGYFLPPDCVYNRVHSRRHERSQGFRKIKEQMDQLLIPVFNDRFLSKWEIHEYLRGEDDLTPFIPETHLLSRETLANMYEKHQSLFIKPIHGSQGRQIFHIFKEHNKLMAKQSTGQPSDHFTSFTDTDAFLSWFEKHSRQTTFIVQQGIPLLLYKNRQIDFRVLCHKNKQNAWKVTSVVARISSEKQFVANLARGGMSMKPLTALCEMYDRITAAKLLEDMKNLALKVAQTISEQTTGITGELGLDIGLDQEGQAWLIEVNSKPSKNMDEKEMKIRPSTKAIVDFCTTLSFQYRLKELEDTYADVWIHDPPLDE